MPRYEYVVLNKNGKSTGRAVLLTMEIAEMERRENKNGILTLDDGRKARRNWSGETVDVAGIDAWHNGLVSDACAVPAHRVKQADARYKKMGLKGVIWVPRGKNGQSMAPKFPTRQRMAQMFKRSGDDGGPRIHNFDGGYSDGG